MHILRIRSQLKVILEKWISGIANYILVADSVGSAQEVIDNMEPIEDYIDKTRMFISDVKL